MDALLHKKFERQNIKLFTMPVMMPIFPAGPAKLQQGTLEIRIDETTRLLIILFFATLPNLIQHSPFINFGEFCQPPLLFQTPRLLIHVHSL